ncbi:hypothetical protein HY249_01555, partial [Candidatus Azambacteria bacterium]|nr:hypothetical protein [Candidatus Azambacteria bacterium]
MKTKTQRFFSPVFLLFGFLFFFSLAGGANAATSSGTFESNPINFGSPVSMSTISWTATGTSTAEDPATCTGTSAAASAGCAVRFQVAVSSDGSTWNSYVGPANSTSEYFITSGGDISFFGNWQYVKFKAYLYSVDGALYTASVSDVTIVSSGYSTSNSLISSAYDTTDPYNTLSGVSWTESNVSGAQDVKLQIRTSNDNVTWTSWYGPTSTADYFDYTNGSNGCTKAGSVVTCSTIPTVFTSGYDDRYVEYQVYLLTGGGISITPPSVSSVAVTYLDNRTPSFESATIDVGNAANFTSISWTATGIDSNTETPGACNTSLTTGSGCAVRFQIALKDVDSAWTDADFKGPDGQNSTYFVSSGTLISNAVFGSHRYIRYRVYLRSINPTTYSPTVSDVTLPYGGYPAEGTFTSSPFNTTDSSAIFGKMAWTATGTTTLETVSFQVRYAPDNAGAPGTWSSWCGYADVGTLPTDCAGTNEFSYLYNNVSTPSGNPLLSSGSHQWMQYKMFLRSGSGTGTPVVSSISMYYVVNAPPEVQMVGTPSQSTTDGKVTITYSTKDIDTALGTNTPNFVTPSFEYWNGSSWSVISSSALATGDLTQKAVNSSTLTQYTATWSPALSFSTATTTEQIRVTVNDGEASHATATATSNAFSMDSKAPVITVATAAPYTTYLVGTSTASNLNITSSDDNTYQIMLSNNADFSSDGINASSGAWITPASSLTWNFGATPVTVYLKAKDAYQNVSSTVTMSAPDTPTDFFISDITTASDFREFVSWQVASSTPGDFLNYQVYKSTDGGTTYSLFQTITDRLLNYVVDSGLSGTQTYYYKALAKDTSGNISPYSTAAYDQPNLARGTTDLVAPVMSNAACSGISTSQLTVTWDTDKISDSSVYYSSLGAATTASASSTVPSMVKNSASTIGGHSVTLTGLNPSRTYNLLLKSVDPYGNTATNSTLLPSCSTLGGPKISTVQASSVGETTATIHWTTDTLSDSVVEYSTDALFATYGTAPLANSVTDHYVNLTSLSVNTKYYYRVKSTDVNGLATDNNGGNFYTFTTTIDTTPPIISSVQAALTRYDSAVITWSTDELADSFVSSITGGTATVPALDTVLTTKHSVVLTGLTAETIYTYNVTSRDGATAHNSATSASYTFTTPAQDKIVVRIDTSKTVVPLDTGVTQQATVQLVVDETPPRVTNLKVVDISDSQATIQWTTDEPATSLVEYGETNKYGFATGSFTYAKDHSVTLKDLRAGREFNYQIRSIDAAGNFNESANKVFSTNPATLTIEEKIAQLQKVNNLAEIEAITKEIEDLLDTVGNKVQPPLIIGDTPKVEVGSSFVKISWNTNRPSGSVIAYSDEMDYNANIPDVYGALSGDADERV